MMQVKFFTKRNRVTVAENKLNGDQWGEKVMRGG